jgi:hypothetical protein
MKLSFFCVAFFCFNCCFSQISIKEIELAPNPVYNNTTDKTIIYPLIFNGNNYVDSVINTQIKIDLFSPDEDDEDIMQLLQENINEYGLTDLSYAISYQNNQLLSMQILQQGCGAHCSSWTTYFNFDLRTGKKLSIEDIVIKAQLDSFGNLVLADKRKALIRYKMEELNAFRSHYIDSVTYNMAIEIADECLKDVDLSGFSILNSGIEINNNCEFPYVIRSQQPETILKYSFNSLSFFLQPEFRFLLK